MRATLDILKHFVLNKNTYYNYNFIFMKNLNMFCLSLEPKHYNFIKELGYLPVGLGEKDFSKEWFSDRLGINISKKNKYY